MGITTRRPHCGNHSNVRFGERCRRVWRLWRDALQGCSRWDSTLVKWVIAGGRYCSSPVLLLKDAVITSNPRCGSRRTFTGSNRHTKFSFIYALKRRSRRGKKTLNCPNLCVFLSDSSLMNYELVSLPHLTWNHQVLCRLHLSVPLLLPIPGLSCLLRNFCTFFRGWILTRNTLCYFADMSAGSPSASLQLSASLSTKEQRCLLRISLTKMIFCWNLSVFKWFLSWLFVHNEPWRADWPHSSSQ